MPSPGRSHITLPRTERSSCLIPYPPVHLAVLTLSLGAICASQLTAELIFYIILLAHLGIALLSEIGCWFLLCLPSLHDPEM